MTEDRDEDRYPPQSDHCPTPDCGRIRQLGRLTPTGVFYLEADLAFKAPEVLRDLYPAGMPEPNYRCRNCGDFPPISTSKPAEAN